MQKNLYLLIVIFFFCGRLFSQEDSLVTARQINFDSTAHLQPVFFDEENIEDYKTQNEFDYLTKPEETSWWTRFKQWMNLQYQKLMEWIFGDYEAGPFMAFIFAIIPYLFLALLLGLIIWLFIRLNPGASLLEEPNRARVYVNDEEEIVQSKDIQKLILEAIESGNFRLAVRYYYLQTLQNLDKKGVISYQFQKTNEDYLAEINSEKLRQQFRRITRIYDFIWYGSFNVTANDFRLAEQDFLQIGTSINTAPNE